MLFGRNIENLSFDGRNQAGVLRICVVIIGIIDGSVAGTNLFACRRKSPSPSHSTVTLFARFLGWSTSVPNRLAIWYENNWSGTIDTMGCSS
jgi:hypothetical protein